MDCWQNYNHALENLEKSFGGVHTSVRATQDSLHSDSAAEVNLSAAEVNAEVVNYRNYIRSLINGIALMVKILTMFYYGD